LAGEGRTVVCPFSNAVLNGESIDCYHLDTSSSVIKMDSIVWNTIPLFISLMYYSQIVTMPLTNAEKQKRGKLRSKRNFGIALKLTSGGKVA
jgi:hypothetical protein